MPSLFKFAETHKADADKFAIITFHQGRGEKTLAECEGKFANLLKNKWKIDKFPFPILMDNTGKTLQAWTIRGFPTAALIDPEGRLVAKDHHGIEEVLEEQLRQMKNKKEGDAKAEKKP